MKVHTSGLRARLEAARVAPQPSRVNFAVLAGLPHPVERYFRAVLRDQAPMVSAVRVRHRGTFNMGEQADRWKPFTSDQFVVAQRPGFDWHGRIRVLPGVPVYVHDAYVAGEGILHASLLGLFTVMKMSGTAEVARGELMRFLAESAWYPTALLPGQGVRWDAVDDRSANATLTDGDVSVTLLFTFNDDDLIDSVYTAERGRTTGGSIIQTPWRGRFWNYEVHGGMRVAMNGEVAWELPAGPKPYWRGTIEKIEYQFVT